MTTLHFVVTLQGTGDPATAQQAQMARLVAIQQHAASIMAANNPGASSAPDAAVHAFAAALEEAVRQAGGRVFRQKPFEPAVPPPEMELREGACEGQCAVCLEKLEVGSSCCRPPCLHAFHGTCLREWLTRSPTCPVCKLFLAQEPQEQPSFPGVHHPPRTPRQLRYRFADIAGFSAKELRYVASFLGISVERAMERPDLELQVLVHPRVRILCCEKELLSFSVARLRALMRSSQADDHHSQALEKSDLVCALFASGRFLKEGNYAQLRHKAADMQAGDFNSNSNEDTASASSGPERRSPSRVSRRVAPY